MTDELNLAEVNGISLQRAFRDAGRIEARAHNPHWWRIRNILGGGNEGYESDRLLVRRLTEIVPHLEQAVIDATAFTERALRWIVRNEHVTRVLVLGVDIPPREPIHAAVCPAGARNGAVRVMYVDDNPLLAAKARALLIDSDSVEVVVGDPTDPTSNEQVSQLLDPRGDPVVTVIPGLLHQLGDQQAATMLDKIHEASPPGSYLIATHALDIDETPTPELLAAAVANTSLEPLHFRTAREITKLVPGRIVFAVVPAREWFPVGPQLTPRVPASDLVAGVVAAKQAPDEIP